uniref:Phosphatidic acid phosphatase type 2/haloperoxidase domain-containing protein n=1 Tax=Lotharella globosa TaxID=91324 RepID=A0A7S3YUE2_9EUKA
MAAALARMGEIIMRWMRKPIKRLRNCHRLFQSGKYAHLGWYIVGTSIHWAFAFSAVHFCLNSEKRVLYGVLVASQLGGKQINKVLKRYFNQKRPECSGKNSNGMPSYHAQAAAFFPVFLITVSVIHTYALPLFAALLVAYSRVAIGMHSYDQIIVGSVIGAVLGWISGAGALKLEEALHVLTAEPLL